MPISGWPESLLSCHRPCLQLTPQERIRLVTPEKGSSDALSYSADADISQVAG